MRGDDDDEVGENYHVKESASPWICQGFPYRDIGYEYYITGPDRVVAGDEPEGQGEKKKIALFDPASLARLNNNLQSLARETLSSLHCF